MSSKKKPTLPKFADMCQAKSGNVTNIAKGFGVDRGTVYKWINKYPKYKQAFEDVRESLLDFTESQQLLLIRGIPKKDEQGNFVGWTERPSETMLIWFEKTRGKHRGYTDSVDHTTNGKDLPAPQLIFSDTPLSEKDLQEIREIEQGIKTIRNDEKAGEDTGISEA